MGSALSSGKGALDASRVRAWRGFRTVSAGFAGASIATEDCGNSTVPRIDP